MARFMLAPSVPEPEFDQGVRSVSRALHVLCAMTPADRLGWSLDEICRQTGLAKSTAHRLLETMAACGFVERGVTPGYYRLGLQAAIVGSAAMRARRPDEGVQNVLAHVRAATNETVGIGVWSGDHCVTVARAVSTQPLRWGVTVGGIFPVHASAGGKVMMASLPAAEQSARLARMAPLQRFTATTITDPARFAEELDRVRADGFAYDNQEWEPGLCCLAVPVPTSQDVRYVLALSVPSVRGHRAALVRYVPLLQGAAAELAVFLEMEIDA